MRGARGSAAPLLGLCLLLYAGSPSARVQTWTQPSPATRNIVSAGCRGGAPAPGSPPSPGEGLCAAGQAKLNDGDYLGARADLSAAIEDDAACVRAHVALGNISLMWEGDILSAKQHFEDALSRGSASGEDGDGSLAPSSDEVCSSRCA